MQRKNIPSRFAAIREAALRAIQPIESADPSSYFWGERTNGGRDLPPYYLVYFLLVELLEFVKLGRHEKVDWSVPIQFQGATYIIEHRKMGLGIFARKASAEEEQARHISKLIRAGTKAAEPFFRWLADEAVGKSELNVANESNSLFERFEYLLELYEGLANEAVERAGERHVEERVIDKNTKAFSVHIPSLDLRRKANWLALSVIDAFFSWTEHIFIHLAILKGQATTGTEVADLAGADWQDKFKQALDLNDPTTKKFFDQLLLIRRQFRNYIAHGAFGKQGEAFKFHSSAGAVPVLLTRQSGNRFALTGDSPFDEQKAIEIIKEFILHLWSGEREPARAYILDSHLPTILTLASDGTYLRAMRSTDDMEALIDHYRHMFDQAADMDW